jgi:hypothetical protein
MTRQTANTNEANMMLYIVLTAMHAGLAATNQNNASGPVQSTSQTNNKSKICLFSTKQQSKTSFVRRKPNMQFTSVHNLMKRRQPHVLQELDPSRQVVQQYL